MFWNQRHGPVFPGFRKLRKFKAWTALGIGLQLLTHGKYQVHSGPFADGAPPSSIVGEAKPGPSAVAAADTVAPEAEASPVKDTVIAADPASITAIPQPLENLTGRRAITRNGTDGGLSL